MLLINVRRKVKTVGYDWNSRISKQLPSCFELGFSLLVKDFFMSRTFRRIIYEIQIGLREFEGILRIRIHKTVISPMESRLASTELRTEMGSARNCH